MIKITRIQSNYLNKLHELVPFLLALLDATLGGLELRKIVENILYVLEVLLAEYNEDAGVELDDGSLINHPRGVGQVFQPLVGQHHLVLPDVRILHVELVHHLAQSFLGVELEVLLGAPDPTGLVVVVQSADEVDEFYIGLIAHDGDGAVQLVGVDLLLATALNLLADLAIIGVDS
jgi:hypothetical protein